MFKILLPVVLLSMSMAAMANDDDVPEVPEVPVEPETVVVRTGTCGAASAPVEDARDCKSVGINVKTGEIVMSLDADGRDVWTEGSTKVLGQLATQSKLETLKSRVLINEGDIADLSQAISEIPSGDKGDKGDDGAKGDQGVKGDDGLDHSVEVQANEDGIIVNADEIVSVKADAALVKADVLTNKAGVSANAASIALNSTELSTVSDKADANEVAHDALAVTVSDTVSDLVETNVMVSANTQGVSVNSADIASLHSFTGESRSMIMNNSSRIDFNSMAIGRLQSDIDRLDGQAAAQVAASSAIMPRDWDGRFAMTLGVGTYRGKIGAAIGIMHDSGSWAVKAQVTGTDADDWSSLAVGASIGFAFQ